jgi:hypothetical protein
MPQPLNRVIPNGEFKSDADVLGDKPELAKLVASIFALWGLIEGSLSHLLVRVLGADAEPALAMFATLTAQHLQMGALKAAARAALSAEDFDVFCAATSVTDSVQTPRNHLAHWIWGKCDQLPDALLLAEPKAEKERDQKMMAAVHRFDEGHTVSMLDEIIELGRYDPATVLVYRNGDLERAKRDLQDAERIAALLTVYLNRRLWQIPRSDPEWERATSMRDAVFRLICEQRLFREAFDRIRADRQNGA